MNKQLVKLLFAFGLFILSILIGQVGFMYLEGYKAIDAFYMTIITVGTVGYTEVRQLTDTGKIFTSVYILFNLAIFAYVASIITNYLFEGKLQAIFKNYMIDKEFVKMKNHVIVCGYGRNGKKACDELEKSKKEFLVIESNTSIKNLLPEEKKIRMMIGDATQDENLIIAGIERAQVILITTPSDAANVFITLTARALNPGIMIISRASEIQTEAKLLRAGANKVIMPDVLGGMFMAQLITKPVVIEFLDLLSGVSGSGDEYRMEEVHYDDLRAEFKDKTLKELYITQNTGSTVIGVKDNVKGLIPSPSPETLIGAEDTLIILGHQNDLVKFFHDYTLLKYEWK